MTKGFQKNDKNGQKKSINRSLAAHYHYYELRIDQKSKNTPLSKELIMGALVDETNFYLDQVKISPSFNSIPPFCIYFCFLGGR
jgi:hypothetical protein